MDPRTAELMTERELRVGSSVELCKGGLRRDGAIDELTVDKESCTCGRDKRT
jgi:hypothetical protein